MSDTSTKIRLSVSRKNQQANEYEQTFSGCVLCMQRNLRHCRVVKQIGQGTPLEKTSGEGASASCWSGGYEQRVDSESHLERRKSEQNKSVSGLPGDCVPPCHYVWAYKDGLGAV